MFLCMCWCIIKMQTDAQRVSEKLSSLSPKWISLTLETLLLSMETWSFFPRQHSLENDAKRIPMRHFSVVFHVKMSHLLSHLTCALVSCTSEDRADMWMSMAICFGQMRPILNFCRTFKKHCVTEN